MRLRVTTGTGPIGACHRAAHGADREATIRLRAGGTLLRRKYAFVDRAGLLDETGPLEIALRDELNNFAHWLTKVGNPKGMLRYLG